MLHKTIYKARNIFKYSEQLPENSTKNFTSFSRSRVPFDQSNTLFDQSNRNRIAIESFRDSKIIFFIISIDRAKVSTDPKSFSSNFT